MPGWILGFYYICKFGDEVTSRFQNIAHSIYACPWHIMPIKMTKHFPMLIAISQQPIYLHGSFNIRCIRETFQKVSRSKKTNEIIIIEIGLISLDFHFNLFRWYRQLSPTLPFCERSFKGRKTTPYFLPVTSDR